MGNTICFRCYFPGNWDNYTDHRAQIPVAEIPRWIEAYTFTHPTCTKISVRVYIKKEAES